MERGRERDDSRALGDILFGVLARWLRLGASEGNVVCVLIGARAAELVGARHRRGDGRESGLEEQVKTDTHTVYDTQI